MRREGTSYDHAQGSSYGHSYGGSYTGKDEGITAMPTLCARHQQHRILNTPSLACAAARLTPPVKYLLSTSAPSNKRPRSRTTSTHRVLASRTSHRPGILCRRGAHERSRSATLLGRSRQQQPADALEATRSTHI